MMMKIDDTFSSHQQHQQPMERTATQHHLCTNTITRGLQTMPENFAAYCSYPDLDSFDILQLTFILLWSLK